MTKGRQPVKWDHSKPCYECQEQGCTNHVRHGHAYCDEHQSGEEQ